MHEMFTLSLISLLSVALFVFFADFSSLFRTATIFQHYIKVYQVSLNFESKYLLELST